MINQEKLLKKLPQLDRIEARQKYNNIETGTGIEVACFGVIAFISAALYPYYWLVGKAHAMGIITIFAILFIVVSIIGKRLGEIRVTKEYFELSAKKKKK